MSVVRIEFFMLSHAKYVAFCNICLCWFQAVSAMLSITFSSTSGVLLSCSTTFGGTALKGTTLPEMLVGFSKHTLIRTSWSAVGFCIRPMNQIKIPFHLSIQKIHTNQPFRFVLYATRSCVKELETQR